MQRQITEAPIGEPKKQYSSEVENTKKSKKLKIFKNF